VDESVYEEEEDDMGGQAFEGKRLNGFYLDPDNLLIVGLDIPAKDVEGKVHFLYDDARAGLQVSESFVRNVMKIGIKEPVIITKVDGKAIVVDGMQRVKVGREAKKRLLELGDDTFRVPVILQGGDEGDLLEISVSANEFRVEPTILDRARRAQLMLDHGKTMEEIARAFGVTTQSISKWLIIRGLSAPVRKAVEEGKIDPTPAAELAGLSTEEQKAKLEELLGLGVGHRPTVKEVREKVQRSSGNKTSTTPGKKVVTFIIEKGYEEFHVAEDFVLGLKFAQGNLENLEAIDGLTEAIKAAHSAPAKKRRKAKE
jgi:ParB-like chromosome segregation protein Spo0J